MKTEETLGFSSSRWASSRARVVFPVPTGPNTSDSPRLVVIVHLVFSRAKLWVGEIYKYLGLVRSSRALRRARNAQDTYYPYKKASTTNKLENKVVKLTQLRFYIARFSKKSQ